jgi:hypothetical protein
MFIEKRKLTVLTVALAVFGLVAATGVLLAYQVPATKRTLVSDRQPDDVEKDLTRLAELQADADLLELTLDGQKASIQHSIQFLSGRVSRYAVQDRSGVNDWQQSLQKVSEQLSIDRESYRKNKVKLALLKYQIARESKALGVSLDAMAPLSEVNRRLDRLEEKIDRLAGALSGKAVP